MRAVKEREGAIGLGQILMTRVKAMGRGLAMGSEDFVRRLNVKYGKMFGRERARRTKKLDEGGVYFS